MNFNMEILVFVFVSGMLLVLIPSIVLSRRKKPTSDAPLTAVEWLDKMELSGVALISKLVVLIAPVPVAMTTQQHAYTYLPSLGYIGSWILAFVVEGLGYAAAYRLLQFIQYNKNLEAQRQLRLATYQGTDPDKIKKAEERIDIDRKKSNAPVKGPAIVYSVYLVVVIIFNVLPEWFGANNEWWRIAMNVCVALLSAPAAYLGAINAVHTEQKEANGQPKNRTNSRTPNAEQEPNEQPNSRTANRPERRTPNEQNPIPQPTNSHPFTIQNTERTERIRAVARQLIANDPDNPPSYREIQTELRRQDQTESGWSLDTISKALK